MMQPTRTLTIDESFFFEHAGYSHDPKTETAAEGRTTGAEDLATAESVLMRAMRVADVGVKWEADNDDSGDGETTPKVRESACIWHRENKGVVHSVHYLASLSSIHDADANYRRVVRAELAIECIAELRAIVLAAVGKQEA